jgi:hypothetical protein
MQTLRTYRFALVHLASAQLVYAFYELQLTGGVHSGNALALGLLLAALSLPAGLAAGWLQWHIGIWLGHLPGDTQAFWPRAIAWQVALAVNFALVALITRSRVVAPSQAASAVAGEGVNDV